MEPLNRPYRNRQEVRGESMVPVNRQPTDLRTRIAAAVARELVQQARDCGEYQTRDCYRVADAVIRELAESFVGFGVWLSEEISGKPLSRIDIESCIDEWKWLNDESRWLKDEDNA